MLTCSKLFASVVPALAAGVLFVLPISASAQSPVPVRPNLLPTTGTKEIAVTGSVVLQGDNPYAVTASYGQFLTDPVEVGLQGGVSGAKHSGTYGSIGAFANYYFENGDNPLVPFVGVVAGYANGGGTNSAAVGAQGGVKYFLNPSIAVVGQIQYLAAQHTDGIATATVGLATFFR